MFPNKPYSFLKKSGDSRLILDILVLPENGKVVKRISEAVAFPASSQDMMIKPAIVQIELTPLAGISYTAPLEFAFPISLSEVDLAMTDTLEVQVVEIVEEEGVPVEKILGKGSILLAEADVTGNGNGETTGGGEGGGEIPPP